MPSQTNSKMNRTKNGECPDSGIRVADDSQYALALRSRTAAMITYRTPECCLITRYSVISQASVNTSESENPCMLSIDILLRGRKCRRGTSIRFIKTLEVLQGFHISPHITTFNIVPDESDIIQCAVQNDLRGVQRLFESRKASPQDVDSRGFSLLSVSIENLKSRNRRCSQRRKYAMHTACSDVFRLLLQEGTGTHNCDSYVITGQLT